MINHVNSSEDLKHNDSIEMEKFSHNKLREMHFNDASRPSDPENLDVFRPTIGSINSHINPYQGEGRKIDNTHEGVDDYDRGALQNQSKVNGRRSLDKKYEFDGI